MPFRLDIEVERRGEAELVQQTVGESEVLARTRAVVLLALVREVRGHVAEAHERHAVPGAVVTIAAEPVGGVQHEVDMREHIGPGLLGVERIVVVEPAAPATARGHRPQDAPISTARSCPRIRCGRRTCRGSCRSKGPCRLRHRPRFPSCPRIRWKRSRTRLGLFGGFLRPGGGYKRQEQDRRIDFFHNRFIIKYVILLSANSVLICPKTRKAANRRQKRPETNISGLFTKTSLRAGIIRTWNNRTTCT